ncbi:GGDEF domain-containing protein [Bradyrhizobium sp. WD16]|uniref:GGDEF domain-containing protein n=1 Tax=Bradyrhizobium sp. WD16 TaxID=1521768 RepID=UPI0020A58D15|nr:GGDEF domain-containing protein [Bradyrhizobium sp. WD16]UTD26429.1 GGDEF domain-containing protein [Bradyrhizobium sp. WD16]
MNLSVSTIHIVVWANFVSLLVVWSYIAQSYPSFQSARSWQIGTLITAMACSLGMLRGVIPPFFPVVIGNGLMIMGVCFLWAGVRQFYGRPAPVKASIVLTAATASVLALDLFFHDSIPLRLTVFSMAESYVLIEIIRDLRNRPSPQRSPGANLVAITCGIVTAVHVARSVFALLDLGGPIELVQFNALQAVAFLMLVFAGLMANFGLVLMAIDRLRGEVAALALADDLTGIANRRQFLGRLSEACALAARTPVAFSLLVIDIDDFKIINDTYGHAAGDECLRVFTRTIAERLRSTDLLARSGGDEFCVILPATRLTEAALLARNLVKACRKAQVEWKGQRIPITTSIGIAEWCPRIGRDMDRLISEADQALYVAKKQGRDRLAVHEYVVERLRQTA